jgi:Family of unknown function (DUF6134)
MFENSHLAWTRHTSSKLTESMRFASRATFALCAFLIGRPAWTLAETALAQSSSVARAGRLDYEVIREGDRIGTHSVIWQENGRHLTLTTHTDIAAEVLGITLYRFRYDAEEDWINGRLVRLNARTANDGEEMSVTLALAAGRLRGICNGAPLDLSSDVLPISPWHPSIVRQSMLFDQYRCALRQVRVTDQGIEPTLVRGQELASRHYAITGQLKRDIWYSSDGQVVQVRFPAADDSMITFILRTVSELPAVPEERASTPPNPPIQ